MFISFISFISFIPLSFAINAVFDPLRWDIDKVFIHKMDDTLWSLFVLCCAAPRCECIWMCKQKRPVYPVNSPWINESY